MERASHEELAEGDATPDFREGFELGWRAHREERVKLLRELRAQATRVFENFGQRP